MKELIERLTKATGPDRELDRAIWIAVGGKIEKFCWAPGHD